MVIGTKKPEQEIGGFKMTDEEATASSWEKNLPHDSWQFHEIISNDFSSDTV